MAALYQALWVVSLILTAGLVASLAARRLFRIYRWFSFFLCFQLAQSLFMLPLNPTTRLYGWAYVLTQPVTWLLNILVVLELYSLALRKHPGITTLSRWVMMAAFAVGVGLSTATLSADLSRPLDSPVLVYFSVVERGLMSSLFLFLLLITAFLLWSPIGVRRNIVMHAGVFSAYFLAGQLVFFLHNVIGSGLYATFRVLLFCVIDACLLAWLLLLTRKGEAAVVVVRRGWLPEDEERLSHQLDALNSLLLKTPRT
jgi:hypothetical protein